MRKILAEFKAFALRGNVMDLAIGVLVGGAFSGLVTALTDHILSPILGLVGGANFDAYMLEIGSVTIRYGAFLTAVINFLIMAFLIFLLVKGVRKLEGIGRREAPPAAPITKACPFCCSKIAMEATRCPHCTSQLSENPESQQVVPF